MTAAATRTGPTQAALRQLIDDASLAPPRSLPMARAVEEHQRARLGPYGFLTGRFMVPAGRLSELATALDRAGAGRGWRIGVVAEPADVGTGRLRAALALPQASGAVVDTLETALPAVAGGAVMAEHVDVLAAARPAGMPLMVELPLTETWRADVPAAVAAIARQGAGIGVKIRCGGVRADAFPSPEQLALVVAACVEHRVPVKATQGLHHPLRTPDPGLGVLQHGFLNLLAAAGLLAGHRVDLATATRVIADPEPGAVTLDGAGLHWRGHTLDAAELARTRARTMLGLGSCSLDEPVADLIDLGVLDTARVPRG